MAVKMRLARYGAKKRPFYRVVVAEETAKRDGRYIEQLGTYNPREEPATIDLKWDRVDYWLGVGVIPSETVRTLMKKHRPAAS
ncbi:MAG: 30S ribosomal protein S16 [Myxococcales bacterium]|nr:30S ribosomal protein S16 [Myxococcales bacterium]